MAAATELPTTAGIRAACQALALPRASCYRKLHSGSSASPTSRRPPARALRPEERQTVLACLHEEHFQDRSPAAVYATLLDEGTYHCSISTMYRVLDEYDESHERRPGQLTLHADRGTSMRSKPVALLLADLGVTETHSRPASRTTIPSPRANSEP